MNLTGEITAQIFHARKLNGPEPTSAYLQSLRPALASLRQSYRTKSISVDYSNHELQEVYLLAYFPHHFELIEAILRDHASRLPQGGLNVTCFGGGPLPELYGILKFLEDGKVSRPSIDLGIFDLHAETWSYSHSLLDPLFKKNFPLNSHYRIARHNFDLRDKNDVFRKTAPTYRDIWKATNLVIFQNFLSETDRGTDVVKNLLHLINDWVTNKGCLIAFIDLQSYRIESVFGDLQKQLKKYQLVSETSDLKSGRARSSAEPAEILKQNFYSDSLKLWPKRKIDYCYFTAIRS
ncbi:MAG TPA: hypothetical protein DCG39_07900 [Opitutae bacterium]|nr:hypothetical protein [Opitutae bacterium]